MRKLLTPKILLFLFVLCLFPAASFAQVAISVAIGPPALPVYAQPPCPVEGHMWTPGYWGWRGGGYYWVPGVVVAAPRGRLLDAGLLGLRRRVVRLACGLLGSPRRILRRN